MLFFFWTCLLDTSDDVKRPPQITGCSSILSLTRILPVACMTFSFNWGKGQVCCSLDTIWTISDWPIILLSLPPTIRIDTPCFVVAVVVDIVGKVTKLYTVWGNSKSLVVKEYICAILLVRLASNQTESLLEQKAGPLIHQWNVLFIKGTCCPMSILWWLQVPFLIPEWKWWLNYFLRLNLDYFLFQDDGAMKNESIQETPGKTFDNAKLTEDHLSFHHQISLQSCYQPWRSAACNLYKNQCIIEILVQIVLLHGKLLFVLTIATVGLYQASFNEL